MPSDRAVVVALVIGFRPTTGPIEWLAAAGLLAVGWCVAITAFGYLWAGRLYDRDPTPDRPRTCPAS